MSERYLRHERQQFIYRTEPSYVCPLADAAKFHKGGEPPTVREDVAAAAQSLGADPLLFAKAIRRAHQSYAAGRARDESGRLTDRCALCGCRMERLGFAARTEEELAPGEIADSGVHRELMTGRAYRITKRSFCATKKEAQQWIRDEYNIAQKGVRV